MQETRRGKSRNSFDKSIKARILIKLKGFGCVRIDPSYRTKMPIPRGNAEMVCVAIDKDKGSQYALKWAVDNLVGKGKYVTLIHVKQKQPSSASCNSLFLSSTLHIVFHIGVCNSALIRRLQSKS